MKKEKQEMARQLRAAGKSIRDIAAELHVSKGSVSAWVADVILDESHKLRLKRNNPATHEYDGNRKIGGKKLSENARKKRISWQNIGREEVNNKDLHLAGCMLYWAEGSKGRNSIKFVNYDPDMVQFFIRFLRECYDVPNEKIRIWVVCYEPDRREEIERYWLKLLDLPESRLGKSIVVAEQKKKKKRYKYGGCGLAVNETKLTQRIFGSIKEYVGIFDDRWID